MNKIEKRREKVCVYVHAGIIHVYYIWLQGDRTCQSMKLSNRDRVKDKEDWHAVTSGAKSWDMTTNQITKQLYTYYGLHMGTWVRICLPHRCSFHPWVGKSLWSRKWQPTPQFLPGKIPWRRSLMGHSPWVTKSRIRPTHPYFMYICKNIYTYIEFLSTSIVC